MSEIRCRRTENRGQKSEVGGQMPDVGDQMSEDREQMPDVGGRERTEVRGRGTAVYAKLRRAKEVGGRKKKGQED